MKKSCVFVCALSLFAAPAAFAQHGGPGHGQDEGQGQTAGGKTKESAADKSFIKKAAQSGMTEIQASRLAAQKASTDEVKRFAQRMLDDHTKVNDELMQIAAQKNVTPPTELSTKFKSKLDKLQNATGEDFDRQYVNIMVKEHQEDVRQFQKQAKNGKDPDLKAFAAKTLPSLREHLQMSKDLAASYKGGEGGQGGEGNKGGKGSQEGEGGEGGKKGGSQGGQGDQGSGQPGGY